MGAIVSEAGVSLRLWAPHAQAVSVDVAGNETPLEAEQAGFWHCFVPGAQPGQHYRFVLTCDDGTVVRRIDPYAAQVTHSAGVGVIYDHAAFDWGDDDFVCPPLNDLVIYELHTGTFAPQGDEKVGDFGDVEGKLSYLATLGVNAIQLMPVAEFAGDCSWGYNPAHIFAVESAYGGPDALKSLVKAAHAHGIAVIQDVVYNHLGPDDLDLWQFDGWSDNGLGGIYFYNDDRSSTPWGDTRPDYGRAEVRAFIHDNAMSWLRDYHMDGLRFDMVPYIYSVDGSDWGISDGWSLLRWINSDIHATFPHAVTIAEDLHSRRSITDDGTAGARFSTQWDAQFVHPVREALVGASDADRSTTAVVQAVSYSYGSAFSRVIYTESHDEVANGKARVPHEIDPADSEGYFARKRSTLGAALVFTSPGVPMLFQGQEFLEGGWFRDTVPVDWESADEFHAIVRLYRDLIRLRLNKDGQTAGLTGEGLWVYHNNDNAKVFAFQRWHDHGPHDDVVVVANLSDQPFGSYRIGMPTAGAWRLLLNTDASVYSDDFGNYASWDIVASEGTYDGMIAHADVAIGPYSVLVYSWGFGSIRASLAAMSSIAWLDQVGASDIALVGGKGANLGELLRAGFPVPNGFVVTTKAYGRLDDDGNVASDLAAEIVGAYRQLVGDSGAAVAVRSSATAEDLADASFAGQQESYLGIETTDGLLRAVADCWASLQSDRAKAYRDKQGVDEQGVSLAAVVQLMVRSVSSGVMFTANPVNGHLEQSVITSAWGLGEAVVAGLVDPDEVIVDTRAGRVLSRRVGDKTIEVSGGRDATNTASVDASRRHASVLDDAQALELAGIGQRIEEHFGRPQDIEWAADADGFHIVQARPITALAERVDEVADVWPVEPKNMYFRASIVEQMPDPLTPLFADLVGPAVTGGLIGLLRELVESVLPSKEEADAFLGGMDFGFPMINGYAYYRYSNRGMGALLKITPGAMRMLFAHGGERFLSRWRDEQLPRYREAVALWRDEDVRQASSARLLGAVRSLLNEGCYYYTTIETIIPLAAIAEMSWQAVHRTLAGVAKASPEVYLLGYDTAPVLAEKALWDLGQWCLKDAGLAAALRDDGVDAFGDCPTGVDAAVWAEWCERIDGYLGDYGHATYNLDFVNPVPADDPAPVLQALRFGLDGKTKDPYVRQAALARRRDDEAASLLAHLDPLRRRYAAATLAWAQKLAPAREDALAAMGLAWPTMRRFLRELGRRVAQAGVIADADDVFWLREDELNALAARLDASEPVTDDWREPVEDRKARWRGESRLRPPQALPKNKAMSLMDPVMPAKEGQQGPVLTGNAGSGGVVTGPARVITSTDQFGEFVPGEILVAQITTPAYTPLFAMAAGVVTDVGGVLSHGSIVAREYGIPAVLGVGNATARIHTGDVITVDGAQGQVVLGDEPVATGGSPRWLKRALVATAVVGGVVVWRVHKARANRLRACE